MTQPQIFCYSSTNGSKYPIKNPRGWSKFPDNVALRSVKIENISTEQSGNALAVLVNVKKRNSEVERNIHAGMDL
jgi:hypothetical protein